MTGAGRYSAGRTAVQVALRSIFRAPHDIEYRRRAMAALAGIVVLVGGLLRLYRFDALSLWLDEGFTVRFSRLPWADVLGFDGAYDPHPPLYYALVKLVAIAVPDLQAGRLLSVATGTLTIVALYLIVMRLIGPIAGLIAGILLAINPLHLWYSQEARQYVPMTLFVALSYLALIEYERKERWRWALLYGGSICSAVYIDYSAIFALLPTLGLILWIVHRKRRSASSLLIAGGGAIAAFLPWLPQAIESARGEGTGRAWYLGVSVERVEHSLLSLLSLHGRGLYYWGEPAPWERWPGLQLLMLGVVLGAAGLGLVALARQSWFAAAALSCLVGGTVLVAAGWSLLSPAYAERTILPATLGLSALIASAPFVSRHPAGRIAGILMLTGSLGLSMVTLDAVRHGDKQHWDSLAADAGKAASSGWPVVMAPAITETLIELYAPEIEQAERATIGGFEPLSPELSSLTGNAEALWFVHVESPESEFALDQLSAEGFVPVFVSRHRDRLVLELLVRPESPPGEPIVLDALKVVEGGIPGWEFRADSGWIEPSGAGVQIARDRNGESALFSVVEASEGLGYFSVKAKSELSDGDVRAFLICQDEDGNWTQVAPDGAGASVPDDGAWHTIRIAVMCPAGTMAARLDIRNPGTGTVAYRDAQLYWLTP